MPYTKAPSIDTRDTVRIPFATNVDSLSTPYPEAYGAGLTNCYIEYEQGFPDSATKAYVRTRPGFKQAPGPSYNTAWTAASARGLYYWDGGLVSVWGDKIYLGATNIQTLTTSSGQVGFTEFVTSTGTKYLIVVDGVEGFRITTAGAITKITDVDFPTPHIPTPVYMDGYLFLPKSGTQDVYNSVLDDPMTWTAGEFLSAESFPDTITGIAKNNQYIYAFNKNSIEIFYDAGNATGTPLATQKSKVFQFGVRSYVCMAGQGEHLAAIVQDSSGTPFIVLIDGMKYEKISTPTVSRMFTSSAYDSGLSMYFLTFANQKFLVVLGSKSSVSDLPTMVYCLDTKTWSMFRYREYAGFQGAYCTQSSSTSAVYLQHVYGQCIIYNSGANEGFYGISSGIDQVGDGVGGTTDYPVYSAIMTPKLDFGTMNRKFCSGLSVIANHPFGTAVPYTYNPFQVTVYWTDNDWDTSAFSNGGLVLTFFSSSNNSASFKVFRLGSFRARSFMFKYTSESVCRFECFDIEINKGQT